MRYEDNDEDLGLDVSAIRTLDAGDSGGDGGGNRRDPFPTSSSPRRDGGRHGGGNAPTPRLGDRVEARVPGTGRWQRATIVGENRNGTLDVRLRDGTEEKQLEPKMVRPLEDDDRRLGERERNARSSSDLGATGGRAGGESYRAGDKVEARFGGRSRWFRGTVERENRDGTYHVIYADGDEERAVEKHMMRRVTSSSGSAPRSGSRSPGRRVISGGSSDGDLASQFRLGDKVEARYKRGRHWYIGTIRGKDEDGRYNIKYEDGDSEDGVDPGLVRNVGAGSTDSLGRASGSKTKREAAILEGDSVEARLGGRSRWFKATVERKNRDGTFRLLYANGEEERAVERDLIRKADDSERGGGASRSGPRRVGDEVEARYKRGQKWYAGVIRRVNSDGTMDIKYRDGDSERDVDPSFVRGKGGASIESLASSSTGERASASRSRSPADRRGVRSTASLDSDRGSKPDEFAEGDRVEARLGGRSRWCRATVERRNRDGSYWLVYAEGQEERSVEGDLIRRLDGGGRLGSRSPGRRVMSVAGSDSDTDHASRRTKKPREGDEVEARYKRGRKWYRGKVRRVNADGTYDIKYADGDSERDVDPGLVRPWGAASAASLATSTSSASDARTGERGGAGESKEGRRGREGDGGSARGFSRGDKVEARYRGRGTKFYKGTVSRVNSDDTLDIAYDDGDKEIGIATEHVNSLERRTTGGGGGAREGDMTRGDRVEARYRGRGTKYYKGKITRVNSDATLDIAYDDGDKEIGIATEHVNSLEPRKIGGSGHERERNMARGDRVEARYRGRGTKFYKGKVTRVNSDETVDIAYDDGDKEIGIATEHVKSLESPKTGGDSGGRESDMSRGDRVEARYRGRGTRFYKGKITRVNSDATLDIAYDDGEKEIGIAREHVNSLEPRKSGGSGGGRESNIAKGDRVEARYRGKGSKFYKGKVSRVNSDGTLDIAYDDGDKDIGISLEHVNSLEPSKGRENSGKSTSRMAKGDRVEARYRGRGTKFYKGKISRVNSDDTFDIAYDDGEKEIGIAVEHVRSLDPKNSSDIDGGGGNAAALSEGDKVEADFRGRGRYYPGRITRARRDGTYDIDYDNGESERMVEPSLVKRVSGGKPERADHGVFEEGEKVEARYEGRSRYYPGKITRVHRDGSYDIDYDDGESERMVEPSLIKGLDRKGVSPLKEGMKVEARYRGRSRYYPGRITRVYRDGSCDIDYDDGERERGVASDLIRKVNGREQHSDDDGHRSHDEGRQPGRSLRGKAGSMDSLNSDPDGRGRYSAGDKVEARLGGRSRWHKATVERENRDGTYDLRYAQGDRERGVDRNLIRSSADAGGRGERDDSSAAEAAARHRVGDEVEARYKRGRNWYPGKIRAVNSDGSYDVRYQDGDFERDVEAAFVRRAGGSGGGGAAVDAATSRGGDFAVGDKVEGRFGGGSRWFKATVERKNRDGTFCLLYADGDEERAVERHLIRKLGGGGGEARRPASNSPRGAARKGLSRAASSETGTDVDQRERRDGGGRSGDRRDAGKNNLDPPRAGDEIEARFRGGSRWLLGRVSHVHRDGSCDVEYEDGRSERDVPASHVRPLVATKTAIRSGDSDSESDRLRGGKRAAAFAEGDCVEARPRGRSTWQKGEVARVHADGTYDVRYDRDGELEKRIDPHRVRLPQGGSSPIRDGGGARASSRGRSGADSSSGVEESRRGPGSGHRKGRESFPDGAGAAGAAGEDTEAAAAKIRRALHHAGRTTADFVRKLERVRRVSGGRDSRGRRVVGGVDKSALERVLAGIGVELSPLEARALRRSCPDADNDGCVDPSLLVSFLKPRAGSPTRRSRSTSRARRPSSSAPASSDRSASESGAAAGARRGRARGSSRSRSRGVGAGGSGSSSPDKARGSGSSSTSDGGLRRPARRSRSQSRDKGAAGSDRHRSSSRGRGRSGKRGGAAAGGEAGTSSDGEESGNTSSDGRGGAGAPLVGKEATRALRKLEAPAFDGSLRREYDKSLGSGRRRELPTSDLKP